MAIHKETLIAQRAYEIWEEAGRPHGLDREHWFQASAEFEETVTVVSGDAPVHASANSVVSGDAPVHGPTRADKPRKVATTAAAKVKAWTAPAKTKATTIGAKAKAVPKVGSAPAKPTKR
jgi:hypothetical protein